MNIRNIEDKDSDSINELYKKLYSPSEPVIDLVGKDIYAKVVSLVAEEGGRIVGFVSGTVVAYPSKTEGQIWDLIVDPEYRKKGHGTKLVSRFEKVVKSFGATYMMVWTDPSPDEEDPIAFYEKNGYKKLKHSVLTKKLK